jgi:hypothetical protein
MTINRGQALGISQVGVVDDDELLVAHAAALGPALALVPTPAWILLTVGRYDDNPGIRIVTAARGKLGAQNVRDAFKSSVQSSVAGVSFTDIPDGGWIENLLDAEDAWPHADIKGHIPRFVPTQARANALWVSRFLWSLQRLKKGPAGVAILLRPLVREASVTSVTQADALDGLRAFFEQTVIEQRSMSHTKSKSESTSASDDGSQRTTGTQASDSSSVVGFGRELREAALNRISELGRSGAWLASLRCFGQTRPDCLQVATTLWASLANIGRHDGGPVDRAPHPQVNSDQPAANSVWSRTRLSDGFADPAGLSDEARRERIDVFLASQGIDLSFAIEGAPDRAKRRHDHVKAALGLADSLTLPLDGEMLLSGERLSSLFQLPTESNPFVQVVRGFDYIRIGGHRSLPSGGRERSSGASAANRTWSVPIGMHCVGGLIPSETDGIPAVLDLAALSKHVLVVGATGAGKSETVTTLLRSTVEVARKAGLTVPRIAILEGAKREYRKLVNDLGIERDDLKQYDLTSHDGFLSLNIFEHPPHMSAEAHVSQLAALFEAALEMPQPVPAIVREALARAYTAYHREPAESPLRGLHPIQYWLVREAVRVVVECNYEGEVGSNIKGVLRTRLSSLSLGAAGRTLAGGENWDQVRKRLGEQSLLLELESIADSRSRSLVMSLFVLFFRYAIEERHRRAPGERGQVVSVQGV